MVELWAQYHLVPSQEYGPVPVTAGGQLIATLPASAASFSHFTAGLGIGLRLGRMGSGAPDSPGPSVRSRRSGTHLEIALDVDDGVHCGCRLSAAQRQVAVDTETEPRVIGSSLARGVVDR